MTIKVTLGEVKSKNPKPFPKLMICTGDIWAKGAIVYFASSEVGIQLTQAIDGDMSLPSGKDGGYASNWDMSNFADYNEPITIQNA